MSQESRVRETLDGGSAKKGIRRSHRKSRNGRLKCKRRKVKCDEEKPACANCIHFGVLCDFSAPRLPDGSSEASTPAVSLDVDGAIRSCSPPRRRGRGRPRKDWSVTPPKLPDAANYIGRSPASTILTTAASDATSDATSDIHRATSCSVNVADTELLLYFTASTALTVAGSDSGDDPIAKFWAHNVPRIGLSHDFVLHLAFAVAGYHLAYLQDDRAKRQRYVSLAERHVSAGLAGFSRALPALSDSNCGALYVSATLVCYYTFAAGPTGPGDFLVCRDDDGGGGGDDGDGKMQLVSLIHGVRLIRATIDPAVLFAGLMAPLGPAGAPAPEPAPAFARQSFPRIDWEAPLAALRRCIVSSGAGEPDVDACVLRCFDALSAIYEATYGRNDSSFNSSAENHIVFAWLYRLEDAFLARLRRREPLALLLFAYYALLFKTMDKVWFMDGWSDHILVTIRDVIDKEFVDWLRWPMEQAGLN